jgi:hypothetical protein
VTGRFGFGDKKKAPKWGLGSTFVRAIAVLMLTTVTMANGPCRASQIIAITKIDKTPLVKSIQIPNATPNIQPTAIGNALLASPERVEFSGIDCWRSLSDSSVWWNQIIPVDFAFINGENAAPLFGGKFLLYDPSNITCWEIFGIFKINVTREPTVTRTIGFYPRRQNIQISALKDSSFFSSITHKITSRAPQEDGGECENNSKNSNDALGVDMNKSADAPTRNEVELGDVTIKLLIGGIAFTYLYAMLKLRG